MESSSADDAPASDVDEAGTPTPPLSPKDDCDSASVASSDHGDGASRDGFYANRATAFVDSIKAKYFSKSLRLGSGGVDASSTSTSKKQKVQLWDSVINVVLVEGRNLLAMDDNGFSDPYVRFRLGTEKYKSKNAIKTLNPQWLEQFDLHMYTDQPKVLEITVWDKDFSGKGDFMGRCSIDLSSLEPETTHSGVAGAGRRRRLAVPPAHHQRKHAGHQLRLGPHRLRGHRRLRSAGEVPAGAIRPNTQFLRLGRRRDTSLSKCTRHRAWPLPTWEARATLSACSSWSTRGCRRTPSTRRCHRNGTRYSASRSRISILCSS
ncbi:hypothetical protein MTO96_003897 [Rhipicephalus appendiculatus]